MKTAPYHVDRPYTELRQQTDKIDLVEAAPSPYSDPTKVVLKYDISVFSNAVINFPDYAHSMGYEIQTFRVV